MAPPGRRLVFWGAAIGEHRRGHPPGNESTSIPNNRERPSRPAGGMARARVSRIRSIHPRPRRRAQSAAPTAPARWLRRSVQSRHGRQKMRRACLAPVRSMPSDAKTASPSGVTSPPSSVRTMPPVACRSLGDQNADLSGNVIIAGAGKAKVAIGAEQARRRSGGFGGDRTDRLDHPVHGLRSDPVIAMPPAGRYRDQLEVEELAKMGAGGRGRYAGEKGEFLRRMGAAVHHGEQQPRPRRIGEHCGYLGELHVGGHRNSLGERRQPQQPETLRPRSKRSTPMPPPSPHRVRLVQTDTGDDRRRPGSIRPADDLRLRLSRLLHGWRLAVRRWAQRRALARMDRWQLDDLGLTRAEADAEAGRRPWDGADQQGTSVPTTLPRRCGDPGSRPRRTENEQEAQRVSVLSPARSVPARPPRVRRVRRRRDRRRGAPLRRGRHGFRCGHGPSRAARRRRRPSRRGRQAG